ncbi:MAG: hypothetical protein HRT37_15655 [Alteromonadaceae bacterium]|nr:hypothetical protein [Alteromonadaceae bacterium]
MKVICEMKPSLFYVGEYFSVQIMLVENERLKIKLYISIVYSYLCVGVVLLVVPMFLWGEGVMAMKRY